MLAERGAFTYETRVAELWPEFAARGMLEEIAAPLGVGDEIYFGIPTVEQRRLAVLEDAVVEASRCRRCRPTCRCSGPPR
jgi:hypothetical protein